MKSIIERNHHIVHMALVYRANAVADGQFSTSYEHVLDTAKGAAGEDAEGYRAEFIRLVETCSVPARK